MVSLTRSSCMSIRKPFHIISSLFSVVGSTAIILRIQNTHCCCSSLCCCCVIIKKARTAICEMTLAVFRWDRPVGTPSRFTPHRKIVISVTDKRRNWRQHLQGRKTRNTSWCRMDFTPCWVDFLCRDWSDYDIQCALCKII